MANSLPVFAEQIFQCYLIFKALISSNKSLNKFSMLGLLIDSWTDGYFEPIFQWYNLLHTF